MHRGGRHRSEFAYAREQEGANLLYSKRVSRMGRASKRGGLERNLQSNRVGRKLCVGNRPAPFPLDGMGSHL